MPVLMALPRTDFTHTVVFHSPLSALPLHPSLRLYKGGSSQHIATTLSVTDVHAPVSLNTYVCPRTFSSVLNVGRIPLPAVTYSRKPQYDPKEYANESQRYALMRVRNTLTDKLLASPVTSVFRHRCIHDGHTHSRLLRATPRLSPNGTPPVARYETHLSYHVHPQSV